MSPLVYRKNPPGATPSRRGEAPLFSPFHPAAAPPDRRTKGDVFAKRGPFPDPARISPPPRPYR
ncbi:hypothetical protein HMPREF0262_02173 [Clostridium sp. ATCC 29733]|nr:hypothetical protein HMPREF0262_02173 [Clostridium sp. ATCC 29733]